MLHTYTTPPASKLLKMATALVQKSFHCKIEKAVVHDGQVAVECPQGTIIVYFNVRTGQIWHYDSKGEVKCL